MIPIHPFQMNYLSKTGLNSLEPYNPDIDDLSSWSSIITKIADSDTYVMIINGRDMVNEIKSDLEKLKSMWTDNIYEEVFRWSYPDSKIVAITYSKNRYKSNKRTAWEAMGYSSSPSEIKRDLESYCKDTEYYKKLQFKDFYNYISKREKVVNI